MRRLAERAVSLAPRAVILALIAMGAGCSDPPGAAGLPFYRTAELMPEWIDKSAKDYAAIHQIRDFTLVDQAGAKITRAELEGRVVVANFFFTQCVAICPTTRGNLQRVRTAFSEDGRLLLVSHSVTPDLDTTERLGAYADQFGIEAEDWHLLTGPFEEILGLARSSYFVNLQDGSGYGVPSMAHTENVVLLDPEMRIRGVYNGTLPTDIARLIEDATLLLGM
jgi:protein SCO1/2